MIKDTNNLFFHIKLRDILSLSFNQEVEVMKIELESIDNLLQEYDIDTEKSLHTSEELLDILDLAVENKVQKPDDFVESIEDLDF